MCVCRIVQSEAERYRVLVSHPRRRTVPRLRRRCTKSPTDRTPCHLHTHAQQSAPRPIATGLGHSPLHASLRRFVDLCALCVCSVCVCVCLSFSVRVSDGLTWPVRVAAHAEESVHQHSTLTQHAEIAVHLPSPRGHTTHAQPSVATHTHHPPLW